METKYKKGDLISVRGILHVVDKVYLLRASKKECIESHPAFACNPVSTRRTLHSSIKLIYRKIN